MEDIILYNKQTHSINLNNSGTMNQQNLDFAKRTMLFNTIRKHTELVKTIQGYPDNDISDVEMTIDCVVISKKRYNKLINFENKGLFVDKKEYLNFPKLEA